MPEVWKDVRGFEGRYQVSNVGRVRSLTGRWGRLNDPRLLTICMDSKGYGKVGLSIAHATVLTQRVHCLVAVAFLGQKPKAELMICHKDDNKENNHATNLYYGTHQQNTRDRQINFTSYHRGTRVNHV